MIAFCHKDANLIETTKESIQFNTETLTSVKNLKVHLFPEARNQILIRLENLSDLFDGTPEQTEYFQLEAYAKQLYSRANRGTQPSSVTISERTLSNNQAMTDMLEEKFHWKSTDAPSKVSYPDDTSSGYAL